MVKKLNNGAGAGAHAKVKSTAVAGDPDAALADAVRTTAQQIWQAGLGAFAKAQKEGSNDFRTLVREGTDLQQRSRALAGGEAIAETTAARVHGEQTGSWDKLEQVFEDRVARALSTMGVPSQTDIQELSRRIEQLSGAVTALTQHRAPEATELATARSMAKSAGKASAKASGRGAGKAAAKGSAKAAPKALSKAGSKAAAKRVAKKTKAAA